MTSFPIHYTYSRYDGGTHAGFAADADSAVAAMRAQLIDGGAGESDLPTTAHITTVEAGATCRTRAEVERHWAAEIAAGWASAIQVHGGYRAEVQTWETN